MTNLELQIAALKDSIRSYEESHPDKSTRPENFAMVKISLDIYTAMLEDDPKTELALLKSVEQIAAKLTEMGVCCD